MTAKPIKQPGPDHPISIEPSLSRVVVTIAGRTGGFGNYVKLNHGAGLGTGYGHMSRIAVRPGQHVNRGQVIGYIGSSGLSTGPHLHYEVYRNGVAVNPLSVSFVTRACVGPYAPTRIARAFMNVAAASS